MRCILVNGAKLKADTCCCSCGTQVGDRYVREIATKRVYCDHGCYCTAVGAPTLTLQYRARSPASWRVGP